ncbi:preprotein translocase subunit SecD [Pseudomonas aeruginosa]|nr:preprotein translocase subunit SecD [Pseudomonas aeruginosa]
MLNKYPLWKYLLILAVLAVGFIYSAPNLYPDDPAVQISGASTALQVTQADVDRAAKALTDAGIAVKANSLSKKGGLIRLVKQDDQLPAKEVVRRTLGDDYVVALNLAQTTPEWLRKLGGSPMKLGLDLSGGVHFLLEVDMDKAVDARLKVYEKRSEEPAAQGARALPQPADPGSRDPARFHRQRIPGQGAQPGSPRTSAISRSCPKSATACRSCASP